MSLLRRSNSQFFFPQKNPTELTKFLVSSAGPPKEAPKERRWGPLPTSGRIMPRALQRRRPRRSKAYQAFLRPCPCLGKSLRSNQRRSSGAAAPPVSPMPSEGPRRKVPPRWHVSKSPSSMAGSSSAKKKAAVLHDRLNLILISILSGHTAL